MVESLPRSLRDKLLEIENGYTDDQVNVDLVVEERLRDMWETLTGEPFHIDPFALTDWAPRDSMRYADALSDVGRDGLVDVLRELVCEYD